jgi:nitroreductase
MTQLLNALKRRFTTKHWDHSKAITPDQLEYITDCIYMAPSKMAAHLHKCVIITDSEEGKKLKDWLFYEDTWHSNGTVGIDNPTTVRGYNGQYRAPVVIAWLNPKTAPVSVTMIYNGIPTNVNRPNFQQRSNDIFISTMAAIAGAEEQGINTGFGSCHDPKSIAEKLGFPDYECPIVVGFGYAKDMTELEKMHGTLIPILDPIDQNRILGYDATNLVIGHTGAENRNLKPEKIETIVTI